MKKTKIFFWIITGLFSAFMLQIAIPEILLSNDGVMYVTMLGFPKYITPFLGVAKLLGIVAILIPGFPRIKEWAYAGLFFDLIGLTYSGIAHDGLQPPMLFMILPISFLFLSYYFHHKTIRETAKAK